MLVAVWGRNTRSGAEWEARVDTRVVKEVCLEGEFRRAVTLRLFEHHCIVYLRSSHLKNGSRGLGTILRKLVPDNGTASKPAC